MYALKHTESLAASSTFQSVRNTRQSRLVGVGRSRRDDVSQLICLEVMLVYRATKCGGGKAVTVALGGTG
jgi:hypothetical protein